ncbi:MULTISPECIES: DUF1963 domain-containing protein [Terrisporobacter]|uniref:Uncharacterized protein n=2 Tax=Terrisporobacter TaxID=1505652 RepID=A0A0B3VWS9_9FIRM|nr:MULTISPECIES: DUF1963 domain-containing protein [Terrisporobacter]KHS57069.1 hypothetical protein QX51_10270 [Terrisporobacter othiniensis]MCC3669397.1 DUF1963 domain-containing protein [Terrisporobacter mayombei]MCR1821674.1 YwqG family protein [Terrisporobacter muris]MDU6983573.1 DUF1963 domain-containing protein [Terrisporobacter othiniensis]MDY3374515.1 DUF1963 domain-containing protein [Terrisporobacter othiniensis]
MKSASFEEVKEIVDRIKSKTLKEVLHIKAVREEVSLYDNKFGGIPYLPMDKEIPRNKNGEKLRLLAQINFE